MRKLLQSSIFKASVFKTVVFKISIFAILFFASINGAQAQMEIESSSRMRAGGNRSISAMFRDSVRIQSNLQAKYYSQAREKHERKQIRKERNVLTGEGGIQGAVTNLSESWIETSGGDNSVTLLGWFNLKHVYTKNLFTLSSDFSTKFGYYRVVLESTNADGGIDRVPTWFKNADEFQISSTPAIKISNNWSYGATIKFRSQFAKGYVSSASQERYNMKSEIMSPAYLDISGGLIYASPKEKFPIKVNFSPVAMSAIYVTSAAVRENAAYDYLEHTEANYKGYVEPYGVDATKTSKYEGGSSIQIDFDRYFGKNDFLRYTTSFFSFYGWMSQLAADNVYNNYDSYLAAQDAWDSADAATKGAKPMLSILPTVRWENKIEIKASKYLATSLSFQMYYNRAQNLKLQTQTLFSVGLSYNFANKK